MPFLALDDAMNAAPQLEAAHEATRYARCALLDARLDLDTLDAKKRAVKRRASGMAQHEAQETVFD
jgi:hypothetical protein